MNYIEKFMKDNDINEGEEFKIFDDNHILEHTYYFRNNRLKHNDIIASSTLITLLEGNYKILKSTICPVYCRKMITIKNGIGYFDDDYIDCIYVSANNQVYEIVPIENKFAVPRVKDGEVEVYYQKYTNAFCYQCKN